MALIRDVHAPRSPVATNLHPSAHLTKEPIHKDAHDLHALTITAGSRCCAPGGREPAALTENRIYTAGSARCQQGVKIHDLGVKDASRSSDFARIGGRLAVR